jgi:hypothetical protein
MPSLASFPTMMQRDREREGLRVCRAAWLVGVSVREYREIEAGDRTPSLANVSKDLQHSGGRRRSVDRCDLRVVGAALGVVWLGIVLWALAAFWRVRDL